MNSRDFIVALLSCSLGVAVTWAVLGRTAGQCRDEVRAAEARVDDKLRSLSCAGEGDAKPPAAQPAPQKPAAQ